MKRIAKIPRPPTDDVYCVSAADVADKLIDRMRRGLDPLLLFSRSLEVLPAGPMSGSYSQEEFD